MLRNSLRRLLSWIGRLLLSLRYRVEVRGLEEVRARGTSRVVFLPSHLALIDPAILTVLLDRWFMPRALGDEYQISRPVVGWLARVYGVRALPNMERSGLSVMDATRQALAETIAGLRAGEDLLFYPAGRLRQRHLEEIRAASGADILVKAVPEARVVLVRQTGLWGSSFSLAFDGKMPDPASRAWRGLKYLLLNGVFFMPRRNVLIEFVEPDDFPRDQPRMVINRYLETFYNARAPRNTYVPYGFWERGGVRELPDPEVRHVAGDAAEAPEATRRIVLDEMARLTGRPDVQLTDRLAQDLGLDSLASAELVIWIEKEFGFSVGTPESLSTVGDVVLAASGKGISAIESPLRSASAAWKADRGPGALSVPGGRHDHGGLSRAGGARCRAGHPRRPGERRGDVSASRARSAADGAEDPRAAGPLRRHHAAGVGGCGALLPGRAVRRQDAGHDQLDDRVAQPGARARSARRGARAHGEGAGDEARGDGDRSLGARRAVRPRRGSARDVHDGPEAVGSGPKSPELEARCVASRPPTTPSCCSRAARRACRRPFR